MKVALTLAASFALLILSAVPAGAIGSADNPRSDFFILTQVGHDRGPSLNGAPISDRVGERQREQPLGRPNAAGGNSNRPSGGGTTADGALQTAATTTLGTTAPVSFDGVGAGLGGYNPIYTPPDTNAAVGATQVVQWVNSDYAVFGKDGTLLAGPTAGNQIWSGFHAGNCDTNNDGDPIVKYDRIAGRWVMSQFSVTGGPPYYQCVAVSTTSDFLNGGWNRYAFSFGNNFPDYPKFGVWPDAYYMSANLFWLGGSFNGGAACALDRAAMVAGSASASGQCFNLGKSSPSPLPADLDGATPPPAGAPGTFVNFGTNKLNSWKLHVDFANNANTTISGPTALAVPAFTQLGNVPQAGTNQTLDSLGDRLMYRLAYRNFGDHESLVVTHSVKGGGTGATRWYELRGSTLAGTWAVYQRSSYQPDPTYRWMGSVAQDKAGNMAIGYSASSASISPQIRYTGRAATDPLNTLAVEVTVPLATGSNTGPYGRWGDYSSMVLDPTDDCTFWFTTEYLKTTGGSFTWSTRIVHFKFASCQ